MPGCFQQNLVYWQFWVLDDWDGQMSLKKTNFGQFIHNINLFENYKNKLNILCQLNLVKLVYMKCVCVKFITVYIPTITSF